MFKCEGNCFFFHSDWSHQVWRKTTSFVKKVLTFATLISLEFASPLIWWYTHPVLYLSLILLVLISSTSGIKCRSKKLCLEEAWRKNKRNMELFRKLHWNNHQNPFYLSQVKTLQSGKVDCKGKGKTYFVRKTFSKAMQNSHHYLWYVPPNKPSGTVSKYVCQCARCDTRWWNYT